MNIKRAKTLSNDIFQRLLDFVQVTSKHSVRDSAMLMLSFKCGLRAKEIAGLRWRDVTDASGEILPDGSWIWLPAMIVKGRRQDTKIPLHPDVRAALVALKGVHPNPAGPITLMYAPLAKNKQMSTNNVTVYLHRLYQKFGVEGCSSHSGRRTFITKLARSCNEFDCSVKDVQMLARHLDIRTTEKYIDPSAGAMKLMAAM